MREDEMTVREVAAALGVHENTVRNWATQGVLTPSRVLPGSGFRRFSRRDVHRMRDEMWSAFAPATPVGEERGDMPVCTTPQYADETPMGGDDA